MEKIQTIEEIIAAYPNEWVLMTDLQKNEWNQTMAGRVFAHDPDMDELYRKAPKLKSVYSFYTTPDPNLHFLL